MPKRGVVVEFESMPYEQAVTYFRALEVTPTRDYRDMWDIEAGRAFTVARLTQLDLLEDVYKHVGKAIEDGTNLAEFQEKVGDLLEKGGWGGELSSSRLENIYRTNLSSAYAAGEWDQMRTSAAARAVRGQRTLLTYNVVGDERTRDEHQDLDGTTLPIGHEFWSNNSPPLDYMCRCWLTEETDDSLVRRGIEETDSKKVNSGPHGAKSFGHRNWDTAAQDALAIRIAETTPKLREKFTDKLEQKKVGDIRVRSTVRREY